jgi:hypothetical protein
LHLEEEIAKEKLFGHVERIEIFVGKKTEKEYY